MERDTIKHVEEERLEAYATESLAENEVSAIEEHLLFCVTCQDRLQKTERYIQAMRSAAKRIREEESAAPAVTPGIWGRVQGWLHTPAPIWAGALALAGIVLMVGLPSRERPGAPVDVELQAVRGASYSTALAGHALNLRLDNRGVAESPSWRIEIVDDSGSRVWTGTGTWTESNIRATVDKSFKPGTYFVRLLKDGDDPLREYQLVVKKTLP
jgi:hypothetical protein